MMAHWTEKQPEDFVFSIVSCFIDAVEDKIRQLHLSKRQLAKMLSVPESRVSYMFAHPDSFNIETIVVYARVLGLKVALLTYDDSDKENMNGPIHSEIFQLCWERFGKPRDMFELHCKGD